MGRGDSIPRFADEVFSGQFVMPQSSPPPLSATERIQARIGTTVRRYRLTRLLGAGESAAVYEAARRNGDRVAIKIWHDPLPEDPAALRFFSRDAYIAHRIGNPKAVPVLDEGVDEERHPFVVMPLLQGETIRARWEQCHRYLDVYEVSVLLSDVLDVLASAHAHGVVHRNIKPDNLFVTTAGDVRVLDFTAARGSIGATAFQPPEQALGDRDAVGPAGDCFAVGAVAFTLLSGEHVQRARSLAEISPEMAAPVVRWVDKALAFSPADRWPSAREMRDALHAAFEEAVGAPLADIAPRVRAKIAKELAEILVREMHGTLDSRPPQMDRRSESPRPLRRADPGVEVQAAHHWVANAFRLVPGLAHRLLAKHGLGRFDDDGRFIADPRPWWPCNSYLAFLEEITEVIGPAKMGELAKLQEKEIVLPPTIRDIRTCFAASDIVYHIVHRLHGELMYDVATGRMLEGIGHVWYLGDIGPNRIGIETESLYPCVGDRMVVQGLARRFEANAFIEHKPGSCRKDGDETCTYYIVW
ncbi:serine/threonine-protein kinase [Pendulispora albinea]|uniref:Serine/threonine protein kinase n=1 Tax=Pendulispora albinea TaxID=2741071 RepID=A0ABZ2LWC1_9BACT